MGKRISRRALSRRGEDRKRADEIRKNFIAVSFDVATCCLDMSGEFDPSNTSNPYGSGGSQNPYAPTQHTGPKGSVDLIDDLLHHINDREFRLDDIFRVSVRLYRRYLRDLAVPALVYGTAFAALSFFVTRYSVDLMIAMTKTDADGVPDYEALIQQFLAYWPQFTAFLVAGLVAQAMLVLYTVIRAGSLCRELDQAPPLAVTFTQPLQRLAPYVLVTLIGYMLVGFGFVFCFFPGIALAVYFSMLAPLIGIGGMGFSALGECFAILKNRFWKTLGVFVVLLILFYVFALVVSFGFAAAVPQTVLEQIKANPDLTPEEAVRLMFDSPAYYASQLPSTIGGSILTSFMAVASAIMYTNYTRPNQNPEQHS